jgi:hypothetical protein
MRILGFLGHGKIKKIHRDDVKHTRKIWWLEHLKYQPGVEKAVSKVHSYLSRNSNLRSCSAKTEVFHTKKLRPCQVLS